MSVRPQGRDEMLVRGVGPGYGRVRDQGDCVGPGWIDRARARRDGRITHEATRDKSSTRRSRLRRMGEGRAQSGWGSPFPLSQQPGSSPFKPALTAPQVLNARRVGLGPSRRPPVLCGGCGDRLAVPAAPGVQDPLSEGIRQDQPMQHVTTPNHRPAAPTSLGVACNGVDR